MNLGQNGRTCNPGKNRTVQESLSMVRVPEIARLVSPFVVFENECTVTPLSTMDMRSL